MTDFLDCLRPSTEHVDRRVHIHPRPRGDLVLCDGRCGASLPLGNEVDDATADVIAHWNGWLVTHSMIRSYHHCPSCRKGVEP